MFMLYSKMNYFEQYENSDAYVPTILKLKGVPVCVQQNTVKTVISLLKFWAHMHLKIFKIIHFIVEHKHIS